MPKLLNQGGLQGTFRPLESIVDEIEWLIRINKKSLFLSLWDEIRLQKMQREYPAEYQIALDEFSLGEMSQEERRAVGQKSFDEHLSCFIKERTHGKVVLRTA